MKSCIYEGQVYHRRNRPIQHEFRYSLYLMYLDLDEVETLFGERWLWSAHRPAVARFRRDDHLGDPGVPLKQAVRDLVQSHYGERPSGPIRLLTHLRYFGFITNPVSFYYCFDQSGEQVEFVVAEVNNTPWGERHCYVLRSQNNVAGAPLETWHAKEFHVSPFMGMDQHYCWSLSPPGEQLTSAIANFELGTKLFDVSMSLRRRPITSWQLSRVLLRYPIVTGQVVAGIYWQALRLWWKRCPFYSHPKHLTTQKANS